MRICVLVGNPKPDSRTLMAARAPAVRLSGPSDDLSVIDLAHHTDNLFTWPSPEMAELTRTAATSDVLIVESPTYKATCTGLLKRFLDRYPARGLDGVNAVPLMNGADRGHAMAPEVNPRPLLIELGVAVATASLYIETPKIDELDDTLTEWVDRHTPLIAGVAVARAEGVTVR